MKREAEPVEIDYAGLKHVACYSVENGIVTVSTAWGSKSSEIFGLTASLMARLMFRELLDEADRRKKLPVTTNPETEALSPSGRPG